MKKTMDPKVIKEEVGSNSNTTAAAIGSDKTETEAAPLASRTTRSKGANVICSSSKERCKTPDSPEGARGAVSPSQSSPARHTSNGSNSPTVVNGSADSLTPPLPLSLLDTAAATAAGGSAGLGAHSAIYTPPSSYATCITRPLLKVKRFLSTLVQFGNDIGQDVGERVRTLVLNLVSSNLSIEDFHQSLQDVTNFPLRPFVLPFLRAHLPLLQREIHTLARSNKQSALQFVRTHEHVVLDAAHSPTEPSEIFLAPPSADGAPVGLKRRASDSICENGGVLNGGGASSGGHLESAEYPPLKRTAAPSANAFLLTHQSLLLPNNMMPNAHFFDYAAAQSSATASFVPSRAEDDEWRSIHVMLNCILSMVEKTKRALTILQQRSGGSNADVSGEWMRKQDVGVDLKKAANDILLAAVRQTEDRVAEVKRRAEDAVNEVKRQAVLELQKAVAAAECKANELVAVERAKMEKMMSEHARKHPDEAGCAPSVGCNEGDVHQTSPSHTQAPAPSPQNCCWNCGRKAHETCSGCSVARYCGPFCQHKDWENHHQICSKEKLKPLRPATSAPAAPSTLMQQQQSNPASQDSAKFKK